jgi:RNA-directed DNA polymerase
MGMLDPCSLACTGPSAVDSASRVHAIFRSLGYPPTTARYLTGLTTVCTPRKVRQACPNPEYPSTAVRIARTEDEDDLLARHLPQGAPTSAALANLSAYRLDVRLQQAASACGARYTRYVDDLCFSGALSKGRMDRVAAMVYTILIEEGFGPNARKTRIMPRSTAQRITGLTANVFPNVDRRSYDKLKATLTNCVRFGPNGQNRSHCRDFRAHLAGRISYVEQASAGRGSKLRALFDAVVWPREVLGSERDADRGVPC